MERFLKPITGHYRTLPYSTIPSTVSAQLTEIENLFKDWALSLRNSPSLLKTNIIAVKVLKAQHLAATVRASALFYRDELAYDAFTGEFKEIIDLAQYVIETTMKNKQGLEFSFDLGVVLPLYLTACKCRHPVLRRKAISMLNRSGTEGLWDGGAMAAAATWAMNYEEGVEILEGCNQFVPEERRLREIGIAMDRNSKQVSPVSITRSADGVLNYVGATVCWGEKITIVAEYPTTEVKDRRLEFWIIRWRARKSNFAYKMRVPSIRAGLRFPKNTERVHINSLGRCPKNKRSFRAVVV